ncbi:geminin coiled-coil domain-containing protein 1 [Mugil cephalus]|uniref:geminin coiled-coil domain-containing protein 1 n=1 Tax=Mugil cephalus TaxID=48193 RepID=UPI001FB64041|nr:geminin coiled-coil domain-containing protein 1 [Mugil cephalus]
METLASFWTSVPADLRDLGQRRDGAPGLWGTPPGSFMWSEQLSPHLQRNQQLQDTLLQREEEVVRLQEENNKLREFLSSSFVRNLEQKAKKLSSDGRRQLKRSLASLSHVPPSSPHQVSKRVCRNLTAEFCSESSGSEPNLDLWVLRTLGLKDRDTIDTSPQSSDYDLSTSLVLDTAVHPSSSPEDTTSTPSSRSPGDPTASGRAGPSHLSTAFTGHPTKPLDFWSLTPNVQTPSQDLVQLSPPAETLYFHPGSTSTPTKNQTWTPISSCSPSSPRTPLSRTDLAFSMSLSPSSSVKTHSFPQGQAFVRRDTGGRWDFTWVPRQGP